LKENEIFKKVFASLFKEWLENTSAFSREFDFMVNFGEVEDLETKKILLDKLKPKTDMKSKFCETLHTLNAIKEYFELQDEDLFNNFVKLKLENLKATLENSELKEKNEIL
jgi:hypothetical protein